MSLELVLRFRCAECSLELSVVNVLNVQQFPVRINDIGISAPPQGWEVHGVEAKCPQHASRIQLADANLAAALRTMPSNGGQGN